MCTRALCSSCFVWSCPATPACSFGGLYLCIISIATGGDSRLVSGDISGRGGAFIDNLVIAKPTNQHAFGWQTNRIALFSLPRRSGVISNGGGTSPCVRVDSGRIRFYIQISLGGGSGHRRDAVGSTQSRARGGGSGRSGFDSVRRNMKGRGRGDGRRRRFCAYVTCVIAITAQYQ